MSARCLLQRGAAVLAVSIAALGVPEAPAQQTPGAAVLWEAWGLQDLTPPSIAFRGDSAYVAIEVLSRRRLDASDEWTEVNTGPVTVGLRNSSHVVLASDSVVLVAVPNDVSRSVDGGRTWTEDVFDRGIVALAALPALAADTLGAGLPAGSPLPEALVLASGRDAFGPVAGGVDPEADVAASLDGGATWPIRAALVAPDGGAPPFGDLLAFARLPESHARAPGRIVGVGYDGAFYSDDGGRTWAATGLFQRFRYIATDVCRSGAPPGHPDYGHLMLVASDFARGGGIVPVIYASPDGITWTERAAFEPQTFAYLACAPGGGLYAGLDESLDRGGFLYSADGGRTWTEASAGYPTEPSGGRDSAVLALELGPDGRLYAATRRGVWRTAEPVPIAAEPSPPDEASTASLSVWPNPAVGAARLALRLPHATERVRVVVYDALGREAAVLHDGAVEAGQHELALNTAALAPGPYAVRADGVATPTVRFTVVR